MRADKIPATIFLLCFLLGPAGGQALGQPRDYKPTSPDKAAQLQQKSEKRHKDLETMRADWMDRLKTDHPNFYARAQATAARQAKIQEIVALYTNQKLSYDDAEKLLTPLVRENLQQGLMTDLNDRIARLEKKLNALKQIRSDPEHHLRKEVNRILKRQPAVPLDEP
ncbi:MAG: hypothetical protein NC910_03635 [Candidatus Omnitrophica bacterium]|nr:hypothetical protein [Candidatus Omnitrophota bacterium]